MAQQTVPEAALRFVRRHIHSVSQLEVLLLLHRTAPQDWDAEGLSRELRIEPGWAAELLALLRRAALVEESPAGDGSHRFAPASPELAKAVESLAASYADRRVTVVASLYSKPVGRIRVLADAFRIRKEESDG